MNNIQHIQCVFDDGGIGDSCARLVPLIYILKHYPNIIIHLIVPDFFKEFALRCFINEKNIIIKSVTDIKNKPKLYDPKRPTYAFAKHSSRMNNLSCHMVDHAFFIMNFQPIDPNDKNYPKVNLDGIDVTRFALPEKYAVLATGYTSEVREWLPKHINTVITFLKENNITPVFLGNSASSNGAGHVIAPIFKEEINYDQGINLIDKTTLLETAAICKDATMVIGLDNGVSHITACTDAPIVIGYTTVLKEHRLPYRQGKLGYKCVAIELTKQELSCTACQSVQPFLYNHKFTKCYTGTKKCLELLNGNKYIEAIKKVLNNDYP